MRKVRLFPDDSGKKRNLASVLLKIVRQTTGILTIVSVNRVTYLIQMKQLKSRQRSRMLRKTRTTYLLEKSNNQFSDCT